MKDTVVAMMRDRAQAPTAPLDDFIEATSEDSNLWWRIDCGHHQNLLEEAVDRMQKAEAKLAAK